MYVCKIEREACVCVCVLGGGGDLKSRALHASLVCGAGPCRALPTSSSGSVCWDRNM